MDADMFFNDYCIVCDRAIVAPKEAEPASPKPAKRVVAGAGCITLRNPDGTITTRTAGGQVVTRPPLRRGPNSANRLAAVARQDAPAPLTRSQTTGPSPRQPAAELSPESTPRNTKETPFISPIYCSRACAQIEVDRSTDLARQMSSDSGLHLITSNLSSRSPYGPPSPLYISGSETSSSAAADAEQRAAEQAASSAPNVQSFFHIHRDADEAWREVNRQRRSSTHPSFRPGQGMAMARATSRSSGTFSAVGPSSDSLNSMYNGEDVPVSRTTSGSGRIRMTPMPTSTSGGAWPIATSVSASTPPSFPIPAEFGSAPQHTFNLWQSYNDSFSRRDAMGTSARSINSAGMGTTPTPPPQHAGLPGSRRASGASTLQRPVGGTIRAKSKTDVTWDSFGLQEVEAAKRRKERLSGAALADPTPKATEAPRQKIQVGPEGCRITYVAPPTRRPSTVSRKSEPQYPGALAIPQSDRGQASSPGRTPTNNVEGAVPNLASLRSGMACQPQVGTSAASAAGSIPRSTWNWSKWEQEGGMTYPLPQGLAEVAKAGSAGKSGLFFFR